MMLLWRTRLGRHVCNLLRHRSYYTTWQERQWNVCERCNTWWVTK